MVCYLYHCVHCHQRFEIMKSMSGAGKSEYCPQCQKPAERVYTAPGIRIKGTAIKFENNSLSEDAPPAQAGDEEE